MAQRRPFATYIAILFLIPASIVWLLHKDTPIFWAIIGIGWWFYCRGEYLDLQREVVRRKIKVLERNM